MENNKIMKTFEFACPYCESDNIVKEDKEDKENKEDKDNVNLKGIIETECTCKACNKNFVFVEFI